MLLRIDIDGKPKQVCERCFRWQSVKVRRGAAFCEGCRSIEASNRAYRANQASDFMQAIRLAKRVVGQ